MSCEYPSVPLADLLAEPLRNGLTRPKKARGSGSPMVNMGELFSHRRIDAIEMERVPLNEKNPEKDLLHQHDLLFARQSIVAEGAGQVSIFLGDSEPTAFESHLIRARVDPEKADPFWVFAFFESPQGKDLVRSIVNQVSVAGIRGSDLAQLPVPCPSLSEQTRAASVLRALDDKIDSNRRLSNSLEATARTYFQAHFVDFVGRDDLVDVDRRRLPQGWSLARVEEFAKINALSHRAKSHPNEIDYIDISAVSPRVVNEVRRLAYDDAPTRARRVVRDGDTLVSTVRPERRSLAFIHRANPVLTASTGFAVVSPTGAAPTFVYRSVTSEACIDYLSQCASGSAYPAVNPSMLATWTVALPPDGGQTYEQVARPMEAKRHALDGESATLAAARDAMLPRLISGRLRVTDTDDLGEVSQPFVEELVAG